MSTKMIQEIEGGVQFRIKVQPRSSKNQVCGIHGDAIKLKLTAPPVDGAANEACQRYLADLFGLAISRIQIISGQTSRNKLIRVEGLSQDEIIAKLGL
ncbi:MAG: DUF167 domain-containing protein [Peptococcia bacterium]